MSALSGDLRDLIEHDQKSARPLLSDLVARLPKSAEARVLLANSYLRSLEAAPALEHSEPGLANVHGHVTNTALHRGHPRLEVSNDPAQENSGNVWSLRAFLKRMKADGRDVDHVWSELRALAKGFLAMVAADGLFKRQAKAAPRRAFPPKLFGLDVLVDADGKPWLIEAQRKPALGGSALLQRINGQMFRTIFEMSCGYALDDAMPAERIALLAKDRAALAAREAEHEAARRGLFEPLG
ncbi:hypothetical protein [Methylocapsa sp. S129]|uniref:hypothetical protein n=1 Tax=Methylocapsa sp. S129 TaxID=1641869 RepID=UPI00131C9C30|nr:hypothetical protein [Methylocapsa sp. S129]